MKAKKRLRGILSALVYFIIYCLVQYIAQGIYIIYCKANSIESFSELHNGLIESTFALSVISSIVSLWIYALIGKIRKEPLVNTVKNNNGKSYVIATFKRDEIHGYASFYKFIAGVLIAEGMYKHDKFKGKVYLEFINGEKMP